MIEKGLEQDLKTKSLLYEDSESSLGSNLKRENLMFLKFNIFFILLFDSMLRWFIVFICKVQQSKTRNLATNFVSSKRTSGRLSDILNWTLFVNVIILLGFQVVQVVTIKWFFMMFHLKILFVLTDFSWTDLYNYAKTCKSS